MTWMEPFDGPIRLVKVRNGVYARQYRNGVINIEGRKYLGYSMTEAIARWRKEGRGRSMTTQQQEGRNAARFLFWERLNQASENVYLRYQRLTARHHGGKWLRGLIIHNGQVRFHYE